MKKIIIILATFLCTALYAQTPTQRRLIEDYAKAALNLQQFYIPMSEEDIAVWSEYGVTDINCPMQITQDIIMQYIMSANYSTETVEELYGEIVITMLSFLVDMEDPNSVIFNEYMAKILNTCMPQPSTATITSGPSASSLDMLSFNNVKKIKVSIGNMQKYFIFDSGASYCIISQSFGQQLVDDGLLDVENDFIKMSIVSLADGSLVECAIYNLPQIKLGDFVLKNVQTGIVDSDEVDFLLGGTVLNAFKSFRINGSKLELNR